MSGMGLTGPLAVPEGGTVLQTLLSTSALMRHMTVRDRNAGA